MSTADCINLKASGGPSHGRAEVARVFVFVAGAIRAVLACAAADACDISYFIIETLIHEFSLSCNIRV